MKSRRSCIVHPSWIFVTPWIWWFQKLWTLTFFTICFPRYILMRGSLQRWMERLHLWRAQKGGPSGPAQVPCQKFLDQTNEIKWGEVHPISRPVLSLLCFRRRSFLTRSKVGWGKWSPGPCQSQKGSRKVEAQPAWGIVGPRLYGQIGQVQLVCVCVCVCAGQCCWCLGQLSLLENVNNLDIKWIKPESNWICIYIYIYIHLNIRMIIYIYHMYRYDIHIHIHIYIYMYVYIYTYSTHTSYRSDFPHERSWYAARGASLHHLRGTRVAGEPGSHG